MADRKTLSRNWLPQYFVGIFEHPITNKLLQITRPGGLKSASMTHRSKLKVSVYFTWRFQNSEQFVLRKRKSCYVFPSQGFVNCGVVLIRKVRKPHFTAYCCWNIRLYMLMLEYLKYEFLCFRKQKWWKRSSFCCKRFSELYVHIFSSLIYILYESWLAVNHGCEKNWHLPGTF